MILLVRLIGNVAAIWVASKVLTLGIALFFVSLVMLLLTSWIVHGFQIDGFWIYVGATIIVWRSTDSCRRSRRSPTTGGASGPASTGERKYVRSTAVAGAARRRAAIRKWVGTHDPVAA
jgi:hypothetical protein